MKNNIGVLKRPSEKIKERKRPIILTNLLTLLLIITFMFTMKMYEPAKNILITGGILVYPFTFLITAYITKYYSVKEAQKSTFLSAGMFTIFLLIVMLCLLPTANNATASHNTVIQYIFANDFIMIGDFRFFFPTMGQFCGMLIGYIASHLLFIAIYNAIHNYTIDYLAMGLGLFIAAIIDRIIFTTLLLLENLLKGNNTFEFFIKCLTSEFIATIAFAVLIIIIYIIITKIKDKKKKVQA